MKNKNQYYEQVAKDLLSAVGGVLIFRQLPIV